MIFYRKGQRSVNKKGQPVMYDIEVRYTSPFLSILSPGIVLLSFYAATGCRPKVKVPTFVVCHAESIPQALVCCLVSPNSIAVILLHRLRRTRSTLRCSRVCRAGRTTTPSRRWRRR
ncbi:unnamed protein product [Phaeothamnion confervicola]